MAVRIRGFRVRTRTGWGGRSDFQWIRDVRNLLKGPFHFFLSFFLFFPLSDAGEKWPGSFLSTLLPGAGEGSEALEKGAIEGWVAVGDALFPTGALLAWRA